MDLLYVNNPERRGGGGGTPGKDGGVQHTS